MEEPESDLQRIPMIIALLRSRFDDERDEALSALGEMVDGAFGDDGAALGHALRVHGGVKLLAWLLGNENPEVQEMALMILGNLCSDAVDYNSATTKRALLEVDGGAEALVRCLRAEDATVVLLAAGTLQNLCQDVAWCEVLVSYNAHDDLEDIILWPSADPTTAKYAAGTLRNMQVALRQAGLPAPALTEAAEASVAQRQQNAAIEAIRRRRALNAIAKRIRAIPARKRFERISQAQGPKLGKSLANALLVNKAAGGFKALASRSKQDAPPPEVGVSDGAATSDSSALDALKAARAEFNRAELLFAVETEDALPPPQQQPPQQQPQQPPPPVQQKPPPPQLKKPPPPSLQQPLGGGCAPRNEQEGAPMGGNIAMSEHARALLLG